MKKILISLSVLLLMAGCGEENKSLTCRLNSTSTGLTTDTKYEIKYMNDDVKRVIITYDYNQNNNATTNNNETDGTNASTNGLDENKSNDNNDNTLESDDVVDGVVGDAIDGTVNGIKDTILDLAGIKSTYQNQMADLDNIEGLTYRIEQDNDNEYKIVYEIDLDKINDSDLSRFDINKDFDDMKSNLDSLGYTCE